MWFWLLQLARQKQLLNETLRQQEQYRQSVRDISDRLDACQRTLDGLKLSVSRPLTDDALDTCLQAAEVGCVVCLNYLPAVCRALGFLLPFASEAKIYVFAIFTRTTQCTTLWMKRKINATSLL